MRSLVFAVLMGFARTALACSCTGPGSPDDPESPVSRYADIIFVGEVVAIVELSKSADRGRQVIRFKPLKVLKGARPEQIDVYMAAGTTSCDFGMPEFKIGERYLMSGSLSVDQKVNLKVTRYHLWQCGLAEPVDPVTLEPIRPPPQLRPDPEWTRP